MARVELLRAYVKARCSQGVAASFLGVRRSTIALWIRKLGMQGELRAIAKVARRDGWYGGGRALWEAETSKTCSRQ